MKKFLLAAVLVFLISSMSYGAVSEDSNVYVRQDVFDAKMDKFMAEIRLGNEQMRRELQETYAKTHQEIQELRQEMQGNQVKLRQEMQENQAKTHEEIQELRQEMQGNQVKLHQEMQENQAKTHEEIQMLNVKLEAMDKRISDGEKRTSDRIDDLKTMIYWGFSILGLFIAFAIFGPSFGEFLRNLRTPSISVDEIKQLIASAIAEAQLSGRPQA